MDKPNLMQKLNACRVALQQTKLAKSGLNKHAGYRYFELSDFLPEVNKLFAMHSICAVYTANDGVARLSLHDADKPEAAPLVFSVPFGSAALKGCHEVQNNGACITYTRRYLYTVALEIVEHDAVDAAEPINEASAKLLESLRAAPSDEALMTAWSGLSKDDKLIAWQVMPQDMREKIRAMREVKK